MKLSTMTSKFIDTYFKTLRRKKNEDPYFSTLPPITKNRLEVKLTTKESCPTKCFRKTTYLFHSHHFEFSYVIKLKQKRRRIIVRNSRTTVSHYRVEQQLPPHQITPTQLIIPNTPEATVQTTKNFYISIKMLCIFVAVGLIIFIHYYF